MKTQLYKYIFTLITLLTSLKADYIGQFDYAGGIHYSDYLKMVHSLEKKGMFKDIPYEEMELKLLRYQPKEFPYILVFKQYSASHDSVEYILFSKKTLKQTDTLDNLVSVYNKNGVRIEAKGFFQSKDGAWLLERYTTKNTPFAKCNACQTYNIETYKLVGEKLVFQSIHPMQKDR